MSEVATTPSDDQSRPSADRQLADGPVPLARVREMFGLTDPRMAPLLRRMAPASRVLERTAGAALSAAEIDDLRAVLVAELQASLHKDPAQAARVLASPAFLEAYHALVETSSSGTLDPAGGGVPPRGGRQSPG